MDMEPLSTGSLPAKTSTFTPFQREGHIPRCAGAEINPDRALRGAQSVRVSARVDQCASSEVLDAS